MLKNIGVIGDIHAENGRLKASLDFLRNLELDTILCTGDIVDGRGDVNDCCDLLKLNRVVTVMGNHDEWFLKTTMRELPESTLIGAVNTDSMRFIKDLPLVQEFETAAGNVLLCHGLGSHTMGKVRDDDYGYALESNFELQELITGQRFRYVLNGHTHFKMVRDFGGITVMNAGSLLSDNAGFMTIHFEEKIARYYKLEGTISILAVEVRI
jgi:predicted phosphodiesterase